MILRVILPSGSFTEEEGVNNIVVDTKKGCLGILPNRLDLVTALVPGILSYKVKEQQKYMAVDQGILVKTGHRVTVSAHHAVSENMLGKIESSVEEYFREQDQEEAHLRTQLAKFESEFARKMEELYKK